MKGLTLVGLEVVDCTVRDVFEAPLGNCRRKLLTSDDVIDMHETRCIWLCNLHGWKKMVRQTRPHLNTPGTAPVMQAHL